jgi:replication-associated recombination protein RarA
MDKYLGRHGLILTTNFPQHVDAAIQSRCELIEMPALSAASLVPMCQRILKGEGVALSDAHVERLITSRNGDLRGVLRYLERLVERVNEEQQTQAA